MGQIPMAFAPFPVQHHEARRWRVQAEALEYCIFPPPINNKEQVSIINLLSALNPSAKWHLQVAKNNKLFFVKFQ